jgi:hypothetical protein
VAPGAFVLAALIQLLALLAPLALGMMGLVHGGVACLISLVAWALIGVPASYAFIDFCHALRTMRATADAAARIRTLET